MNIIIEYKYLAKPLLVGTTLYLITTNLLRYFVYLFMIIHLSSETYQVLQSKNQQMNLSYLSKFWTLFSILLASDFILESIFGYIPLPMLTNIMRLVYILWLTYHPSNVLTTYTYIERYIGIISGIYNTFLLYAFALLY